MKRDRDLIVAGWFVMHLLASVALAAPAHTEAQNKDFVIDGSRVHDVGELHLNVTNFGLIGSRYSLPSSFSDAPSAMWPAYSGINHLWSAGLWVGAVKNGEHLVSTGQYEAEILAREGEAETIYLLSWDQPGASRFPFEGADDDGDGLEDEDPLNGLDDDLDGAVDEDAAGAGDQEFRAETYDDTDLAQQSYPDHTPLELKVVQRSLQWAHPEVADFVGFEFDLINIGDTNLEQLHVGMFSDFDIDDPQGGPGEAADDMVGFDAATVEAYPGQWVDVQVAHAHEGYGATVSGWMGWALLGHPVDPAGLSAPEAVQVRSFQRYSGQAPYHQGGDPVNDGQRYESLAADDIDADSIAPEDYRLLTSCGPFASLAPGAKLTVAYALVAGADRQEMLRNAGRARLVYEGLAFDRDGDPENGAEFVVRWLGPEELAVSVEDQDSAPELPLPDTLAMAAAPNPFNPSLEAACSLPRAGHVKLTVLDARGREVRVLHDGHHDAGVARWRWDGRDAGGRQAASGVYLLHLETEERVSRKAVTLVK